MSESTVSFEALSASFAKENLPLRRGVLGSQCTTYAIGGELFALFEPQSQSELLKGLNLLNEGSISYKILGNGSNLLISDKGVSEVVIRLGRGFRTLEQKGEDEVIVGGSYSLMALSREVSERGLSGLEFAGGIPASIGGAVFMNAGAHGGELADRILSVDIALPQGELVTLAKSELSFSYRHSLLPKGALVVRANLKLTIGDKGLISRQRAHFLESRKRTQPLSSPSAGSVFKNPVGEVSAGAIIESVGLKGAKRGGALVSPLHANWITNPSRTASSQDVMALICLCQELVLKERGKTLTPEVIFW